MDDAAPWAPAGAGVSWLVRRERHRAVARCAGTCDARVVGAASGEQITLRHGAWEAVVVEVGGGLRTLTRGGVAVLDGYAEDEMASGGCGQVLMPWPNRLSRGAYAWEGRRLQAPLTEPSTCNAIHGLVRWLSWTASELATARCAVSLRLRPQPGYPFDLDLRLDYQLGDEGLEVRMAVTNRGDRTAPFGAGFHPYLTAGTGLVDDARLTVPAASWLPADARGIPTGERRPVAGERDLRGGGRLGPRVLDDCFADLARDADGVARVTLAGPAGAVSLWMDAAFGYCMVFTGDTLAPARRRRGVAIEPMTCAPDAFNSGDGLRALAPGERFEARWGVTSPAGALG